MGDLSEIATIRKVFSSPEIADRFLVILKPCFKFKVQSFTL